MKRLSLCLMALLSACAPGDNSGGLGRRAIDDCGTVPTYPGHSAAFQSVGGLDRVLLTREDWARVSAWREASSSWMDCVAHHE